MTKKMAPAAHHVLLSILVMTSPHLTSGHQFWLITHMIQSWTMLMAFPIASRRSSMFPEGNTRVLTLNYLLWYKDICKLRHRLFLYKLSIMYSHKIFWMEQNWPEISFKRKMHWVINVFQLWYYLLYCKLIYINKKFDINSKLTLTEMEWFSTLGFKLIAALFKESQISVIPYMIQWNDSFNKAFLTKNDRCSSRITVMISIINSLLSVKIK